MDKKHVEDGSEKDFTIERWGDGYSDPNIKYISVCMYRCIDVCMCVCVCICKFLSKING